MDTLAGGSPLSGIKVLELGTLIAAPYSAAILAQFGADVVKIESPVEGDSLRKWRKLHKGTSLWWYSQSRNKKSVTVDLRTEDGSDIVRRLATESDIVIENFRPGVLEKWGLGWEQLSALNPKLIMVRISGYGQTGPQRARRGFAAVAECMGGLRYVTGFPDRPPTRVGISLGDTLASLYGTIGALLAMHHLKVNGGKGQFIDIALYEAVFSVMESLLPEYSVQGYVRERSGASLPGIAPSNTYKCRDGQFIVIAANSDGIFSRLMRAIDRVDLAENPAFAHNNGRAQSAEVLDVAIEAWTLHRDAGDVLQTLEGADVPCGRIYSAADIVSDEQYKARHMIERHTLPDGTPIDVPGIVPKLSETPGKTNWLGPELGAHTAEVLASIGITPEALQSLRARGIV